jgi:hypothetical protein
MRKPIEAFYVENLMKHRGSENKFCDEDDVRELESYTAQLEEDHKAEIKELMDDSTANILAINNLRSQLKDKEKCNDLLKENLLDNAGKTAHLEKKLEEAVLTLSGIRIDANKNVMNPEYQLEYIYEKATSCLKSIEQEESDE